MTWSCVFGAHPDGCHCVSYFPKKGDSVDHNCTSPDPRSPEQKAADAKYIAEHTPGKRISFTVVQLRPGAVNEIRYDADRLESIFRDVDMHPMLSFVSSGKRITIPHEEVVRVEFYNVKASADFPGLWDGVDYCPTCDNRFTHVVRKPGLS